MRFVQNKPKKRRVSKKPLKLTWKSRSTDQEDKMRALGYISVQEAAMRIGVNSGVIYRAMDAERLKETVVGDRRYVDFKSFQKYAGPLAGELAKPPKADPEKEE